MEGEYFHCMMKWNMNNILTLLYSAYKMFPSLKPKWVGAGFFGMEETLEFNSNPIIKNISNIYICAVSMYSFLAMFEVKIWLWWIKSRMDSESLFVKLNLTLLLLNQSEANTRELVSSLSLWRSQVAWWKKFLSFYKSLYGIGLQALGGFTMDW